MLPDHNTQSALPQVPVFERFKSGGDSEDVCPSKRRIQYMPLNVALETAHAYDAHTAQYAEPSHPVRLTAGYAANKATMVHMATLILDVDCPTSHGASLNAAEKAAAYAEWLDAQVPKLERLLGELGGFVYLTSGGLRIVYLAGADFVMAEWSDQYLAVCAFILSTFGIEADTKCADWQHLFRLPCVVRDGAQTKLETMGTLVPWRFAPHSPAPKKNNVHAIRPNAPKPPNPAQAEEIKSFLLPHWTAGNRNALALAVPGYLGRQGLSCEAVLEIIAAVGKATGDDEDRSSAVHHTFERLEKGETVTGAPKLIELLTRPEFERLEKICSFKLRLRLTKNGSPAKTLRNTAIVLEEHPAVKGAFARNEFNLRVEITRKLPLAPKDSAQFVDTDTSRLQIWLDQELGFDPGKEAVFTAVAVIAEALAFHPVRDYLQQLTWDGVERVERLFTEYFGAPDTKLNRHFAVMFLQSCVARVMEPGCQVDTMPVLLGEQGAGKSRGIRALCPKREWFSDTELKLGDKDAYQQLDGKWLYEIGELQSFRGRGAQQIKGFLSSQVDHYRVPYGRSAEDHGRQCVFIGTTNEEQHLSDETGNRRFLPISTGVIDVDAISRDRDQMWAEALHLYQTVGDWWKIPNELRADLADAHGARMEQDPWADALAAIKYGPAPLPRTSSDIFGDLGLTVDRHDTPKYKRLRAVLAQLGWTRLSKNTGRTRFTWIPPADEESAE